MLSNATWSVTRQKEAASDVLEVCPVWIPESQRKQGNGKSGKDKKVSRDLEIFRLWIGRRSVFLCPKHLVKNVENETRLFLPVKCTFRWNWKHAYGLNCFSQVFDCFNLVRYVLGWNKSTASWSWVSNCHRHSGCNFKMVSWISRWIYWTEHSESPVS